MQIRVWRSYLYTGVITIIVNCTEFCHARMCKIINWETLISTFLIVLTIWQIKMNHDDWFYDDSLEYSAIWYFVFRLSNEKQRLICTNPLSHLCDVFYCPVNFIPDRFRVKNASYITMCYSNDIMTTWCHCTHIFTSWNGRKLMTSRQKYHIMKSQCHSMGIFTSWCKYDIKTSHQ